MMHGPTPRRPPRRRPPRAPSGVQGLLCCLAILSASGRARAASLDVSTNYRMRAVSYTNLDLQPPSDNHSFISNNAELGLFVKNISLLAPGGEEQTMDVGLALRGIGVAGSSTPIQQPFVASANYYPNTNFTPFIENAYVRLHQAFGYPVEATFGQQPFTLGSGLLLADDGAGFAGANIIGSLPFWGMKADGFVFQPRNSQASPNSLMVYGATLELPTEGVWQLNELFERDRSPQFAAGGFQPVNAAHRQFTSVRYQLSYGPFVFDGEAALERGAAFPAGPSAVNPSGSRIGFNGNAQIVKAKWRQPFAKIGEGIARVVVSRGSGYSGKNRTVDDAFFPSHGHRYDGLERAGLGDFFGATPYDGFGGKSSSTASGIPQNLSGIQTVGLGFTPPAWRGIIFDFDFFLFQADKNDSGPQRTLGHEYDLKLRYAIRDRVTLSAGAASFTAGDALSVTKPNARRLFFEAQGRF